MSSIPRICSADGCEVQARCKGLCARHYKAARDGRILPVGKPSTVPGTYTEYDIARFWRHVNKTEECWEWIGQPSQAYPEFRNWVTPEGRVRVNTHVASYQINKGPITDGLWVLHRCDNTRCVRPDHLFLGTPADNTQDMYQKGRARTPGPTNPARGDRSAMRLYPELVKRGERHGMAILQDGQVREIRRLRASGVARKDLPCRFGVSQGTIDAIIYRRLWKHIE